VRRQNRDPKQLATPDNAWQGRNRDDGLEFIPAWWFIAARIYKTPLGEEA
jgi:hypothetical protein